MTGMLGAVAGVSLLVGGIGVAYLCNAARTFFLVWISAKSSTDAVAKWHDSVGMAVLIALLYLWNFATSRHEVATFWLWQRALSRPRGCR